MKILLTALSLAALCLPAVAQTPEQEPAAKTEWVLFDGKSLKDWEMVDMGGSGDVTLEGGQLIINQGDSLSGAVYKKVEELPLINYEITLQAKRLQGVDFFCGFRLRVTAENISAWLDDKQVVDQDIKDRKVSLREGPMDAYAPLSLTTYNTMAAIKNVRMKALPAKP